MTDRQRKNLYYRTRPEWRRKRLESVKERHARLSKDPMYRRLVALRKDIHRVRESLEARQEHAARLEKRLVKLAREKQKVEQQWKSRSV